jgi:hypothetical protein
LDERRKLYPWPLDDEGPRPKKWQMEAKLLHSTILKGKSIGLKPSIHSPKEKQKTLKA